MNPGLKDIVAPGLDVLFVGYNPGVASLAKGHHFAGPGNYFWALLFESGLTGERLTPERDREVGRWSLGISNIVDRMTPGSADLRPDELKAGGERLWAKIARYQPRVACFLGKDIYRHYARLSAAAPIAWGLQPSARCEGVAEFVAPNPSRRSTLPYVMRLNYFRELKALVDGLSGLMR